MSENKKTLFLLDAYALIYRAHFAFSNNPRISSKGVNTGVMYGFTNTLLEVLQKQKPTHIAVAFDTSKPTFRHEEYVEYKANRQETPEDIRQGVPIVKNIIEAFNIPILLMDGYEADDIVGTIAKRASKEGFKVYMMTPDKDYGQLVDENVFLYKPAYMGNAVDIMGVKEVCEKWGIENVDQVRDILGLQGDSSDNIPGIPGIGPKTAAKLLEQYGTVEDIIKNADQLKGKQKEKVIEFAEQGILSKHLATIVTDVPIEYDLNDFEYKGPDESKLRPIFADLEFRTLIKRVFDTDNTQKIAPSNPQLSLFSGTSTAPNKTISAPETAELEENIPENFLSLYETHFKYHLINTEKLVDEFLPYLKLQKEISIETVSNNSNPINADLLGIAISYYPNEAYYVPNTNGLIVRLKEIFENESILKIGHNIKYNILIFKRMGIELKGEFFDNLLAHYLIEAEVPHQIEVLAEKHLYYNTLPESTALMDKSKRSEKIEKLETLDIKDLACEAADKSLQIAKKLKIEVKTSGVEQLLYDIEIPLSKVLAQMEYFGVKVNKEELDTMSVELEKESAILEKSIFDSAGEEFNINSPKQLGEILFDKLQLVDKPKKTKSGQYATGEEVLSKLSEHDIVNNILEYRELQKLKSTYVDALPGMMSDWDGRIHTNYSQSVAATGRLSSINPNLQNIPIRTKRGKLIRKAFVPANNNFLILSADYSQIELRIMASFAKDQHMIDAFKNGRDIHATTASRVFGVPLEEVDDAMRRKAKSVNFGLIYGQTAFGLGQNLNISRSEASEIIDAYFKEFSAVRDYMDLVISEARENEYVETILKRKRILRDINSRNQTMRGFAERNAINAPIQGSAADIIKIAMIDIAKWLNNSKLKTRMIMQVHDELVFEVEKSEREEVTKKVRELMMKASDLEVPMEVDIGIGENWLEAH